jgi:N-acyl-D-amino-acid deacylase
MTHDVIIRRGTVVDGSGGEPGVADITIDSGLITTIGLADGRGAAEIDAAGALVTPGFIDLHTHFDAQVAWDPFLLPSSQHGVTTALMGNCGMTFAPLRPGEQRQLADMMEAVEEIPADSIESALPWTWESFGEYLDFVERCRPALNVAGMVGHCALRFYVMGERAASEHPSPDEIDELARLTADALRSGAAGFSTSRFPGHKLLDHRAVPGTYAGRDELEAIAGSLRGKGLLQAVLNTGDLDPDFALLTDLALMTGGPVLVATAAVDELAFDDRGQRVPARFRQPTPSMLEAARARGADITATLMTREGGAICGLYARLPWRTRAWAALDELPHSKRLAAVQDGPTRDRLIDEASTGRMICRPESIFSMGDGHAHYMAKEDQSLLALAAAHGESTAATFLRMAIESGGRAMFFAILFNRNRDVLEEMLTSDCILPGLGDAGAHLARTVDGSYTTFYLSHWVRDTATIELPEAIRRLTSAPAALLGDPTRGRLEVGLAADVNVIDLASLSSMPVEPRYDAPLGGPRLIQNAKGYRATLVNGEAIVLDDKPTGRRPGKVLRSFADRRE